MLFSTVKEDTDKIEKYGPMVPTPFKYGNVTIDAGKDVCEKVKQLLEREFRLE